MKAGKYRINLDPKILADKMKDENVPPLVLRLKPDYKNLCPHLYGRFLMVKYLFVTNEVALVKIDGNTYDRNMFYVFPFSIC